MSPPRPPRGLQGREAFAAAWGPDWVSGSGGRGEQGWESCPALIVWLVEAKYCNSSRFKRLSQHPLSSCFSHACGPLTPWWAGSREQPCPRSPLIARGGCWLAPHCSASILWADRSKSGQESVCRWVKTSDCSLCSNMSSLIISLQDVNVQNDCSNPGL